MKKSNTKKNGILDLGCGKKKRPGTIGVDHSDRHDADIVHDLNIFPYPFEMNSVDKIYIDNCLEHLDSPLKVMEEIHRILKLNGQLNIIVPYFRSRWAFIDPTHKTFYTVNSFAYYDPEHIICQRYDYTDARFKIENICFNDGHANDGSFKKIIIKIANAWPDRYERYLSNIIPLDEISYNLTKI